MAALALLVGSASVPAAAEVWPQAPFGTPPSFSQAYPHPLYPTGRFISLPQLVREHKPAAARGPAVADNRAEAFAALQKFASRGDVGPPESALAYGPPQISPQVEAPREARPAGTPKARIHHVKSASLKVEVPHEARPVGPPKDRIHHPKSASLHPADSVPVHPAKPATLGAPKPPAPHPHAVKPVAPHPAKPGQTHLAQHRERHRGALPPPLNILPPAARTE
jgi:hypothetical protein